jgi:hypothetical protein
MRKTYNHLVDIAFSVEGPWDNFNDIPLDALLNALKRRVATIEAERNIEAFGDCNDVYRVE